MKTYPYIGQAPINGIKKERDFDICLFHNTKSGTTLEANIYHPHGYYSENWNEGAFKNITTEYLANTYGEVKSKEHAKFIKLLAEVNNLKVWGSNYDDICTFIVTDGELSFHNHDCKRSVAELNLKLITIPLPPKQEDEKMNTKEKTSREKLLEFMHECYHRNKSDFYTFSQEFVDHIEMKESTDLGWPKIGSKVTWADSTLKGEVASIGDCVAWVKKDNGDYETVFLSLLNKPKTPEQELRDLLLLLWEENNHDFDMLLDVVTEHVIKKPQ